MSYKLVTMETEDNYLFMFMTPRCLQLYKLSNNVQHFYNASKWTFFIKGLMLYTYETFFLLFSIKKFRLERVKDCSRKVAERRPGPLFVDLRFKLSCIPSHVDD